MARIQNELEEVTGKTVLASPALGILELKGVLDKMTVKY